MRYQLTGRYFTERLVHLLMADGSKAIHRYNWNQDLSAVCTHSAANGCEL